MLFLSGESVSFEFSLFYCEISIQHVNQLHTINCIQANEKKRFYECLKSSYFPWMKMRSGKFRRIWCQKRAQKGKNNKKLSERKMCKWRRNFNNSPLFWKTTKRTKFHCTFISRFIDSIQIMLNHFNAFIVENYKLFEMQSRWVIFFNRNLPA